VAPGDLRGTVQNDVLKEYAARGNYIFPPRPSMRLTVDVFRYCNERLPRFNTISISGYHIREAGSTAAQEIAFTLANGIAYVQAAVDAGLAGGAWFRSAVPRKRMKELMRRSDYPAVRDTIIWLGLILAFGALVVTRATLLACSIAAPMAWTRRSATRAPSEGARPQTAEATENTTKP